MTRPHFKGYQSILCLNGTLPDASFFTNLNLPVIAADGAANHLLALGIIPKCVIGDFDSFKPSKDKTYDILYQADQNSTDYRKSLHYLKENGLLPAIIVGINGGYLDHILNNINIFIETDCMLYAPPLMGYVFKEGIKYTLTLPYHSKISLFGCPFASVSSKGLKWELIHSNLSFPGDTSCFNRTKKPNIVIDIHKGTVLALIYEKTMLDAGINE